MSEASRSLSWALWPIPFVIGALICAATGWPSSNRGMWTVIAVLNFGLLYGVLILGAWLWKRSFPPRIVIGATVFGIGYHVVAALFPTPTSGWVRIGFGDLMIAPGAIVYSAIDDVVTPLRRAALGEHARLERALTTDDDARFRVIRAAEDDEGWVLHGRLEGGSGLSVAHLIRLKEPFAVTTTVLDIPFREQHSVIADGALYALSEDQIISVVPGENPNITPLPAATKKWLWAYSERQTTWDNGRWLVLVAGASGAAVGTVDADGVLTEVVELPLPNAYPHSVVRVGDVIYALTEHYQPQEWAIHVIDAGVRDEAKSKLLTDNLTAHNFGSPLSLVGGTSRLWLLGYNPETSKTSAVVLPDGQPVPIEPGSMTAVIPDGNELLVSTLKAIIRVTPDGTRTLVKGWFPGGMMTVRGHVPSAASQRGASKRLTLASFDPESPRQFLPDLWLFAEQ